MTTPEKFMLVMNYLRALDTDPAAILDAVCDENLEQSFALIQSNPQISKAEFLTKMQITEE